MVNDNEIREGQLPHTCLSLSSCSFFRLASCFILGMEGEITFTGHTHLLHACHSDMFGTNQRN